MNPVFSQILLGSIVLRQAISRTHVSHMHTPMCSPQSLYHPSIALRIGNTCPQFMAARMIRYIGCRNRRCVGPSSLIMLLCRGRTVEVWNCTSNQPFLFELKSIGPTHPGSISNGIRTSLTSREWTDYLVCVSTIMPATDFSRSYVPPLKWHKTQLNNVQFLLQGPRKDIARISLVRMAGY